MKVTSDTKNSLLKRKEIIVVKGYEKNPGFLQASQDVTGHFKAEQDAVVIKKVIGHFGSNDFRIEAFIYDSAADKDLIEPKKKVKKEAA